MADNTKACEFCGAVFQVGGWAGKRFCSNACRQANYRALERGEDTPRRQGDQYGRAITTKLDKSKNPTCQHCGKGFFTNGLQGAKRYCSDACKQKAYRERKARELRWAKRHAAPVAPVAPVKADPVDQLNRSLANLADMMALPDDQE